MTRFKRRVSVVASVALVAFTLALTSASPVSAGTQTNVNSCQNSATGTFTDLDVTISGTAAPNPQTLGAGTVTVTGGNYAIDVPADVLLAGYNLGLLVVGLNTIPGTVDLTVNASNTAEGSVDLIGVAINGTTTISDPDGTPGTGDESATPLAVSTALPDTTWTPTGGDIDITDGGSSIVASVAGGLINVTFTCEVGTSTPAGCIADPLTDCTGFAPAAAVPYDTVTVIAPPTPPVCSNSSGSVGANQSTLVDLAALCSDVNGDIDPSTFAVSTAATDGTVSIDAAGVATYTNTSLPGSGSDSFGFTVNDVGGNGPSVEATITITVLGNLCNATSGDCSLTQVVTFTVIGDQLTMEQTGQFVTLSSVTLDGSPQAAVGSLNDITVVNERGDGAAWTVSAYATDFVAPGGPTVDPDGTGPLPAVADCSPGSALIGGAGVADHLCVPGDNLGWAPSATILHDVIPGDVAAVTAGPASAADATDWLNELINTGNGDGIGGYEGNPALGGLNTSELCSAGTNTSGGTFGCDADLWMGVPASAGAGTYAGAIILTLS